jgi:hypothetical protein
MNVEGFIYGELKTLNMVEYNDLKVGYIIFCQMRLKYVLYSVFQGFS